KIEDKLGMRASVVGELVFNECRVPVENLLGNEGEGFKIAMATLDRDRTGLAAVGVGLSQACLDAAKKYAKERKQFGQPLARFQHIQFTIADMAVETEAARLLTYKAASLADAGKRFSKEAAMAKLYASEVAMRSAINAVQIHGAYGCTRDYPVERYFRDAKVLSIAVGTSEMQRLVISREEFRS
ncbi:acyl-CoA dehydrogenase family protein, partial [Candidatus Alkanophaga liquidiphilum]